jgi:hypothetical protein
VKRVVLAHCAVAVGMVLAVAGCGIIGGAAVETVAGNNESPPGVEGSILYVRLIEPGGSTVLDRSFDWVSDRQPIPPGEYNVVVSYRVCDGNCSNLGPEHRFCERSTTVGAG